MVAPKKLRKFPIKAQTAKKSEFQFNTNPSRSQWPIAGSGSDNNNAHQQYEDLIPSAMMTNKMIKMKRSGVNKEELDSAAGEESGEGDAATANGKAKNKAPIRDVRGVAAADGRKANLTNVVEYGYKQDDGARPESVVKADAEAHRMAFSNGFRKYLSANNLLVATTETNEDNVADDFKGDEADDDDNDESDSDDGVFDEDEDDDDGGDGNDNGRVASIDYGQVASLRAAATAANSLVEDSLRGSVITTATATVSGPTLGAALLLPGGASSTPGPAVSSSTVMAAVAAAAAATVTATAMPYLDNNILGGASVLGVAAASAASPFPLSPASKSGTPQSNGSPNDDDAAASGSAFWNLSSSPATNGSFDGTEIDFLYRHSLTMTVVYCVAYVIVFLVGFIGNSFVISVVMRAPRMRTVTNYFIMNLAIADILVIVFCLPATLMSNVFVPWMLGWLMCKTVPYVQGVSVAASVYSLIAVSLDRFIAIWWPLKQMTKSRARFMIICIWVIALGSTIPWLLFFDLVPVQLDDSYPQAPEMYLCQEVWPPGTNGNLYFLLAHLVACYLLPMSLITLCYVLIWIKVSTRSIPGDSKDAQMDRMQQKSKVKVIKMLVAVVILFVLSWLPLYVIFARIKFGGEISNEESEILNKVTPLAQWLGSSNSCINPILYAFFNKKYRRGFAAIIQSRSCCGRLRYYDNVAIASSTTSTRKSSHYHNSNRKSPNSPGLRKTNAVSYIYEHNSLRRTPHQHHHMMLKQDSNLSQQMLLKQDSHGSRQFLIKQESASSDGSRRLLCQQDSNGSKVSKQDSVVSYMEGVKQRGQCGDAGKDPSMDQAVSKTILECKRQTFMKQDSVISFVDQRPEPRRNHLIKQDSVISFADQRGSRLTKQDCHNSTSGGHHVSILKKTDSQHSSNGFPSPRRNVEIYE